MIVKYQHSLARERYKATRATLPPGRMPPEEEARYDGVALAVKRILTCLALESAGVTPERIGLVRLGNRVTMRCDGEEEMRVEYDEYVPQWHVPKTDVWISARYFVIDRDGESQWIDELGASGAHGLDPAQLVLALRTMRQAARQPATE